MGFKLEIRNGIARSFEKWSNEMTEVTKETEDLKSHFENLSDNFNYVADIDPWHKATFYISLRPQPYSGFSFEIYPHQPSNGFINDETTISVVAPKNTLDFSDAMHNMVDENNTLSNEEKTQSVLDAASHDTKAFLKMLENISLQNIGRVSKYIITETSKYELDHDQLSLMVEQIYSMAKFVYTIIQTYGGIPTLIPPEELADYEIYYDPEDSEADERNMVLKVQNEWRLHKRDLYDMVDGWDPLWIGSFKCDAFDFFNSIQHKHVFSSFENPLFHKTGNDICEILFENQKVIPYEETVTSYPSS